MPKIKNDTYRHKGVNYDYELHYTSKERCFYIPMTGSLDGLARTFLHVPNSEHRIKVLKIAGDSKIAMVGETEVEAIQGYKKFIDQTAATESVVRRVIILENRNKRSVIDNANGDYYASSKQREQPRDGYYPEIEAKFGFKYATETTLGTNEPFYEDFNGRRISVYSNTMVLDDTPENRHLVESLYDALGKLTDKLYDLCDSKENFLEVLNSGQRLLN